MSTEVKGKVPQNQIPINKDKLKEEQKAELKAVMEAFEQQCLLSYSINRSGEIIKKYDFPTLPPYNVSQKEDRMIHLMNQTIGQTFINHTLIMANYDHNDVLKTLQDKGTPGFVGPAYQQASKMVFSPTGSATGTSQINPQAQADGNVIDAQPISTVASTQFPPVYTNSTPMATYALGSFVSGYPTGWDPTTGFGIPLEYMIPSPTGQPSTSASQPMNQQVNASAPQPTQPQDVAPTSQPSVMPASVPSPASPSNVSAPWPTPQQQSLAMILQSKSPT
jgi:hypothetical protein